MVGTDTDNAVMARHGTKGGGLLPANVVQAAEADLLRFMRNRMDYQIQNYEPFAFHRAHVGRAMAPGHSATAAELITLALADAELPDDGEGRHCIGRTSHKRNTRRLYSDPDLLRAAIAHMKAQPAKEKYQYAGPIEA